MADYNPNQFAPDAQSRARRNPESPATDMVDHPAHYGGADDPYEAVKVIEAWGLPWHLGDCVKYIARHGKKDPTKIIEDLKKARWYLDRYITHLETMK